MIYQGGRAVAECSGAMSRVDKEHVREVRRHQSHVRASKRSPFIEDSDTFSTSNVDLSHAAGHSIEASSQNDNIELMFDTVRRLYAFRCKSGDSVFIDVDEADVRLVEHVVVILEIRFSSSRAGHMLVDSHLL